MEKEQFEELLKLLKEMNDRLRNISSYLRETMQALGSSKDERKQKGGKAHFKV